MDKEEGLESLTASSETLCQELLGIFRCYSQRFCVINKHPSEFDVDHHRCKVITFTFMLKVKQNAYVYNLDNECAYPYFCNMMPSKTLRE